MIAVTAPLLPTDRSATLYAEVAARITAMIAGGAYRPGDRLPSVRALHVQLGVSVSTVIQAYQMLEDQGAVRARPQSGYYVCRPGSARPTRAAPVAEPIASPPTGPRPANLVSTAELVTLMMSHRARPDVDGVVDLGVAVLPDELVPAARLGRSLAAAARASPRTASGYAPLIGCAPLRVQAARRLVHAGCTLSPDDVVVTNGGQEALTLALSATCRPGDTVAVESPSYFGFWQVLDAQGLRAVEVASDPRTGLCLDDLATALDRHPIKAVVAMPTFSNPTGSCMPERRKRQLVAMLAERDVPLIEDDVYGEVAHAPGERPPAAKAFDRTGNVVLCSSTSKTLAPGYRIGWMVPGRYRQRVVELKFASTCTTATAAQMAVADVMEHGGYDKHLRRVCRAVASSVEAVRGAVGRHFPAGTRVSRPAGGYVLWVELPAHVDSLALYDQAAAVGVLFAPGPMFSAVRGGYRNFLRLNAAAADDRVESALSTLGRLAAASA